MSKYTCELCLKEFKQKIDYTRHTAKKNACITVEKLQKITEQKVNEESLSKDMTTLFSQCMNILRDGEHLTGDKALRNLSYLLVLRLLEPMIGKTIDFEDFEYDLNDYEDKRDELLSYLRFSTIASDKADNIPAMLSNVWRFVLCQHPKTRDIFLPDKGFDMKKQSTFKKLVDRLAVFPFESVTVDIQGKAYEDLLKGIMTGKVLGQYFTQPLVKDMMVELIDPQVFCDGTIETIFDPAMGTGGFLLTSLRHIQKQAKIKDIELNWDFITQGLGGREAEPDTFILTKTNMLVSSGHIFTSLEQGDSIRSPITNKYDIILANPPFGIKGLEYKEITSHLRDTYMPIESKSAVPLFLQAIIYMMKINGRCAMVMPDGQELFGKSKALVALREYLMKTCELKEILYLPSGVFSNTTIKTCVLYFHKKKEGTDVVNIGGKKIRTYTFSKVHQTKTVKFYDYNPYEKVKNFLVEVDIDKIVQNGYSLNYAEYLEKEEDEEEEKFGDVEWKTLGEVCEFLPKSKRQASYGKLEAKYPFFKSSNKIDSYVDEPDYTGEYLIIGDGGESNINYGIKFSASDHCYIFTISKPYNTKYIYYYIKCNLNILDQYYIGVAIKNISKNKLKQVKIPIPHLAIQQDIVSRCEKIDKLITDLEAQKEKTKELAEMILKTYIEKREQEEDDNIIIAEDEEDDNIIIAEDEDDNNIIIAKDEEDNIIIEE